MKDFVLTVEAYDKEEKTWYVFKRRLKARGFDSAGKLADRDKDSMNAAFKAMGLQLNWAWTLEAYGVDAGIDAEYLQLRENFVQVK